MATVTTTETVNTSTWNLPQSTTNTVEVTNSSTRSGDDRIRNVSNVTTTVQSSTSESIVSTAYNYKTTGTSYSPATVGEEIVNTETSAIQLLAQPFMKAGENVKVIGSDFAPNTEIRLYLDEIVMSPVVGLNNYTKQYTRPWLWSWCYDYSSGLWKLYCPYSSNVYYYDYNNDVWKTGSDISSSTVPLEWVNRITRTPWIIKQIEKLDANSSEKTRWIQANSVDITINEEYKEQYSESRSTIVTDENGYFEAYITIPENTATGKHNIIAETVLPAQEDVEKYRSASTTLTGESYFRHSDTVIYKREVIEETVYRDVEVMETWQKYANVSTTITTTTGNVTDYGYYDPVAQTFKVDTDQFLVGVDVFFSGEKPTDSNKKPWIAIREVVNGVPSESMIYAADIDKNIINNADDYIETTVNNTIVRRRKPTYIEFDYPIYVSREKTYAFTLGCNESGYKLYYSQIGNKDVMDGTPVVYQKQQSESGVMMTSSNNSVWSAMQEADLTYSLYKAVFDTGKDKARTIYVKDIKPENMNIFSSINVSVANTVFENTGIDVYYAITTGNNNDNETPDELAKYNWHPMNLETLTTFNALNEYKSGMNLKLRFDLWTLNSDVSPIINFDSLEIFIGKFKDTGNYIQNVIELN